MLSTDVKCQLEISSSPSTKYRSFVSSYRFVTFFGEHEKKFFRNRSIIAILSVCVLFESYIIGDKVTSQRTKHIPRKRRPVSSIFEKLGPTYTRRAYRMSQDDFWYLCALLRDHIGDATFPSQASTKKHRNGARNGIIRCTTRVSAAFRYMAGGSVYDIALVHGISTTQVYESVWVVVDAINQCGDLSFEFPSNHQEQLSLAKGFQELSDALLQMVC